MRMDLLVLEMQRVGLVADLIRYDRDRTGNTRPLWIAEKPSTPLSPYKRDWLPLGMAAQFLPVTRQGPHTISNRSLVKPRSYTASRCRSEEHTSELQSLRHFVC